MNDEKTPNARDENINLYPIADPLGNSTVTILHGKALDPKPLKGLNIVGNIETPAAFWEKRGAQQNKDKCYVERTDDTIELTLNEDQPHTAGKVVGKLILNEECFKWGINQETLYSNQELARLIKKNEYLFIDRAQWLKIYNSLTSFEARIKINIIDIKEASGDREAATKITVEKEVATSFKLRTRIYGRERLEYSVDLNGEVVGQKVNFYLDSSDLAYIMSESKEKALDEHVQIFRDQEVLVIDK